MAFTLKLDDRSLGAGRIITATGSKNGLPEMPGVAARWAEDMLHCAFCCGYEMRGQHINLLATGPMPSNLAALFRLLSPYVTVLAHTAPPATAQGKDLVERGITVLPQFEVQVLSHEDRLTGCMSLHDGSQPELDALFVETLMQARADFLGPSACSATTSPSTVRSLSR
ncbi:NAD(P)/FAD-dependent oxidoreductase [Arthrobacter burdickii]|uniref:Uncharacterized protein n=1 Tax=Arthrobacter burdickii TaxID=3035920 RepID=A0ABT8K5Z7_9MICC|nr:hypothetical protein [Arthrobacter burdickii]MDN4612814.1 hypothetical protein [Arthrobacter burdickii]